jgi:hypothetical protein
MLKESCHRNDDSFIHLVTDHFTRINLL